MSKTVAFVHDHVFDVVQNVYYSNGGLPKEVWSRYLNFFDEVKVVGRLGNIADEKNDRLVVSSLDKVNFSLIKGRIGAREITEQISKELAAADALVVRLPSRFGIIAMKEAKKLGTPCLVEVVGCGFDGLWYHGSLLAKMYAPYMFLRMKLLVSKSRHTLYVTEKFLQHRYPSAQGASTVACSNVEIEPTAIDVLEKRIRKIKESDIFKLGIIASLNSNYKGIDTAVYAIKKLLDAFPKIELHVVGPGDPTRFQKVVAKEGLEQNVYFIGSLDTREKVFSWLDSIDLYLQPSLTEGLPRALVEAMSRGCPAIASSVGGVPELLKGEFLHQPGNIEQLYASILYLLNSKDSLGRCAKVNFETARKYQKSVIDKNRSSLFKEFLDAHDL